jgi:hypothetical protein
MYKHKKSDRVDSKYLKKNIQEVAENMGIDFNNGEVIVFRKRDQQKEREPFVKIMQKALEITIQDMSPAAVKMFMYFISKMFYGNFVEVDQKGLQNFLQLSRPSVNKALNELKERGIIHITMDRNDKRRNTYMINMYTAWKGTPKDRVIAIKKYGNEFPNPQQKLFLDEPKEE